MTGDILLLSRYERQGASSRVRSYQFLDAFEAAGLRVDVCPLFDDDYVRRRHDPAGPPIAAVMRAYARRLRDLASARGHPVVWVEYEVLPWLPFAAESWLYAHRPVVVDYDDAIFHRYDSHASASVRRVLGRKIDRIMAAARIVVAGNDYLAERARAAGARQVEILPSVVDPARYSARATFDAGGMVVGWIGSPATTPHLASVAPALASLRDLPGLRVETIGAAPFAVEGVAVSQRPWSEAAEAADIARFDVGIMPLPDDPWSRGKCGYKLIQYMASGLPVVASPVGANRRIVEHGVNGFLAGDLATWSRSLRTLHGDPALRARFGAAGRARVVAHYSRDVVAPRLVALFEALLRPPEAAHA